jgi:hypothetical protein
MHASIQLTSALPLERYRWHGMITRRPARKYVKETTPLVSITQEINNLRCKMQDKQDPSLGVLGDVVEDLQTYNRGKVHMAQQMHFAC